MALNVLVGRILYQQDVVVPVVSKEPCHHAGHAGADDYDGPFFSFERDASMIEVVKLYVFGVVVKRPRSQAAGMFV